MSYSNNNPSHSNNYNSYFNYNPHSQNIKNYYETYKSELKSMKNSSNDEDFFDQTNQTIKNNDYKSNNQSKHDYSRQNHQYYQYKDSKDCKNSHNLSQINKKGKYNRREYKTNSNFYTKIVEVDSIQTKKERIDNFRKMENEVEGNKHKDYTSNKLNFKSDFRMDIDMDINNSNNSCLKYYFERFRYSNRNSNKEIINYNEDITNFNNNNEEEEEEEDKEEEDKEEEGFKDYNQLQLEITSFEVLLKPDNLKVNQIESFFIEGKERKNESLPVFNCSSLPFIVYSPVGMYSFPFNPNPLYNHYINYSNIGYIYPNTITDNSNSNSNYDLRLPSHIIDDKNKK